MKKIPKQVSKDPRRQECGKKSHEKYMKRLKNDTLKENQLSTFFSTNSFTSSMHRPRHSISSSTDNATARSTDTYICRVGIVDFLARDPWVFFAYNKNSYQTTNKEQVKEPVRHSHLAVENNQVKSIKPPK